MAKELPFFKFEPGQWENGNIQMCTFEVQGVFINLCSVYWQRLGDLPYKLALQKVCGGNATALDSLCKEGAIKISDDKIRIDFLDEQLSGFEHTSKTNSQNAHARWKKQRKDATAMRPHESRNAIREEKRREEESIEDKIHAAFDEIYLDQQKMHWKHIDFDSEYKSFLLKIRGSPEKYNDRDTGSLRLALQAQLRNAKTPKSSNGQKNRYKIQ